MPQGVTFEVEEAGCSSCAERIAGALSGVGSLEEVTIDAAADTATVRMAGSPDRAEVAAALARTSEGSGHSYRIRDGSWLPR